MKPTRLYLPYEIMRKHRNNIYVLCHYMVRERVVTTSCTYKKLEEKIITRAIHNPSVNLRRPSELYFSDVVLHKKQPLFQQFLAEVNLSVFGHAKFQSLHGNML